jgi:WD40 repeat protein
MEKQEQKDRSLLTLFYSYADKDEELCEELEKHLSSLQRQRTIAGWHRRKILPGEDLNQTNDEQFFSAQIIVLLISPDFLASDASHAEMELALQRHTAGLASVIPLLLRPVDWQATPIAHLQVLPRNGRAVTKWEDHDEALAEIAEELRLAIEEWKPQQALTPGALEPFLTFARKDLSLVKSLKDDLRMQGIMAEKGRKVAQPEDPEQDENEAVREAIRNAPAVVLVATPHTRRSRSVKQELQIAEMYQRSIYLFWVQGNHLMEVMPTGWSHLPAIDARAERYPQALQELTQALGRKTALTLLPVSPIEEPAIPLASPRNPYKGLQAFRTEDAEDFFGRDRLIEELLEQVKQLLTIDQQEQAASRLLAVLGPSGSGKSSVVMAGLIPRLKQGGLAESRHWIYLDPMVPGKDPLEALTLTLTALFPERSLKSIREDLEDDSARGLHLLLTTCVKQSDRRVLLVVDQFEELFTQTATEGERRQFLDILLAAISEPHGPLIGILTLRADFYDRPLQYPELGGLLKSHQVIAFPMETPDLRKVIEQPARLPDVQLTFEEGLVGDLLFDVQGQIGALPLLQFTLDQLFQQREERMLTLHAYQQIGGVKGALAQHAEATYRSLPTERHQRLARALFLRLINPGTIEGDATRRRIPRSELVVVDQEETSRLAQVTDAFTQARLLTANSVREISTVEVSHEALLLVWTRLQDWLHEAREDIPLQQDISEATAKWNRTGQPADRLYRGSELRDALRWRESNLPSLDEDRFLQACIKERQHEGRRRFLIGLISIAGVAGMTGAGSLVTALLGSQSNGSTSRNLFQQIGLPYTYSGHTNSVSGVAWSPDGKRIASASYDKTVQVWDGSSIRSSQLTYQRHTDSVFSVAWSPDGKRIASASYDKTVQVWDASSGNHLLTYQRHTASVPSAAWSPDGKRIASASADKTVQVWDASSGNHLLTYQRHTASVLDVAWSPDSKRIASASADKTVQVWDASSGNHLLTYGGHTDSANSVAWSPDGKRIASAFGDTTVQVWDVGSRNHLLTYQGHSESVLSVAWSPDSKRIASASYGNVQVWDAGSGNHLLTYQHHSDWVNSAAWSPDGKRIASTSSNVQVWDAISTSSPLFSYQRHTDWVYSVAWSPDSKRIASACLDKTVQVWDASSGNHLLIYQGHTDSVLSVAWSPDGKRIASSDKTVQVWDASSGNHLLTYGGHTDLVLSVAWSPDGKRIASASSDKTVQVWDATRENHLLSYLHHTDWVYSVAWSPDGKRIASASRDKTVRVWDASSGKSLLTYRGHTDSVSSAVWSPGGKRIASASSSVQIWDAASGKPLLTYEGHTDSVSGAAWSPDGKRIASASTDKTVQIWDSTSGERLLTYKGHTDVVTNVAWSLDGKLIASGSYDQTVQVYDGWAW